MGKQFYNTDIALETYKYYIHLTLLTSNMTAIAVG